MSTSASGLHVLHDSGVPNGSSDYTTLVILHGYAWHSGIFSRLSPLAPQHNTRLVLVNRRDYPGARPYDEVDRRLLSSLSAEADAAEIAAATQNINVWMARRAREVYDLLTELVKNENVPPAAPEKTKGGIIVAGWSFGSAWMTALLAHVASFDVNEVDLSAYVRRVVFLDPAYHTIGLPPPDAPGYHPLFDPEIPPEDRGRAFSNWVSGYYNHGDTFETLQKKTPLQDPPPTLSVLTPEEVARTQCLPPGAPGGSDALLLEIGLKVGVFAALKDSALYLPGRNQDSKRGDAWPNVEVRHVSCERSVWELPVGTWALKKELETAKQNGKPLRIVKMVLIRGANHFAPWDAPELALRALVGDEDEVQ
ncbi:hypothetical protein C8Q78DRAFT_980478 [Trametes maxima]|nr:hypothetical protein C8Q78DRAFT_980478 [Trametes maxima]